MACFFRPVCLDLLVFCSSFFSFYSLSIWFSHVWGKHWLSAREAALRERWGTRHMVQAKHLRISDAAVLLCGPGVHFPRVLRRNESDTRTFQEPWCTRNRIKLLEETAKESERYIVLTNFPNGAVLPIFVPFPVELQCLFSIAVVQRRK